MRTGFLLLAILLISSASARAEKPAPAPEPAGIAATVARLQRIQVEDSETRVPAAARPLLAALKNQIRDLLARELRDVAGPSAVAGIAPERLRADLIRAFARAGVTVGGPETNGAGPYGDIAGLDVRKPAGHENLLAVRVTLGIACGSDTSLYLFQRREGVWRPAFSLESQGYAEISGAMGIFDFGVSPPDPSGSFFVVAADVNPSCASNWQRLRWRVWRLGGETPPSKPFFEGQEGIYLGSDDTLQLAVTADGFRVSFQGYQGLDTGVLVRDYVRAYRVRGTQAERVPPLATEPEGFLDEWIGTPWADARRWTGPKAASAEVWHGRLAKRFDKIDTAFDSFEVCGKERSRWQIGLDLDPDPGRNPLPRALFFTVSRQGADFRLDRIDVRPLPGCVAAATPNP